MLVLDLMVPELNGFEVIDFLKSENMTRPGRGRLRRLAAGADEARSRLVKLVISKPFDVDEFTKAILALCAEEEREGCGEVAQCERRRSDDDTVQRT